MWNHMWGWDGYGGAAGWGWFALMHVGWWLLLVVGAVVVIRALLGARAPQGRDSALDVLRERYARGEIDQAEYEQRRRILQG